MGVLTLPRLVFSGFTDWNPDTVNNSAGIYNEVTAEPVPQPGVPWDQFVAWLLASNGSTNPATLQPNGSWNVYGDHGVTFTHPDGVTSGATITGITLSSGPVASDPLLGSGVQLLGLLFMDSPKPAPARLVDVEPYGPFSSQIFFEKFAVGNATVGVTAGAAVRMFSRWPNLGRNLGNLPIAGDMGVLWQTAARNQDLTWAGLDKSPALAALKAAAESGSNQGLILQFVSYRTLYYQTVTYQGRPIRNGADLIWAYQQGYKGGNPARSVLLGLIGVWGAGDLASAPVGRLLAPNAPVVESARTSLAIHRDNRAEASGAQPVQVPLGPAMAAVDSIRNVVTVNFIATFPETGGTLDKANLGTMLLQAVAPNGTTLQVGPPLPFSGYNRQAYEAGGGIVEFPFQASHLSAIMNGTLQLVQQGATGPPALLENPYLVETDQRGSYIDEGETHSIRIAVYQKGGPPSPGVKLLAAQYDNNVSLITTPANRIVQFTGTSASGVLTVTNGAATLEFTTLNPGCCYIVFYPFTGSTPPTPPAQAIAGAPATFYAVIRALPFDNALEQNTPDSQLSFSFIYNNVLETYDLIYPVMSLVRDLHNKNVVTAMSEQLKFAISLDGFQSTLYMPITRELSAGKRKLLQRYVNLLPNVPPDPS